MSGMQRFLGGSPGSVLVRLVFLSLLAGAFMALLDITPPDLLDRALDLLHALRVYGMETFGAVGRWLIYGAMVVVPLWLVARLLSLLR